MFQEPGNSFMDKVSNLSDQPLLSAATHPDTNPTPPHISQKVVSLCHSSTHKCVYVMQHLVELASNNSKSLLSRIKAVRLMQELVLKGDPTFQQLLQKEEHRLKPVGNFLDQRNPFESSRLREAVSDLLEVLFEENSLPVPSSLSSLPSLPSPPPNLGLSRPVYQGFGNPYFPSNRPSSTGPGFSSGFSPGFSSGSGSGVINQVSGKVSEILSRVPPPDPNRFVGNQPEFGQRGGSGSQYAQNDTFYPGLKDGNFRSGTYQQPQLPATNQHIPGVVGASWSSGGEAPIGGERTGNGTEEERGLGNLERGLVVEFVSVGGVRGKPTRQEVEELLVRSKSLDTQQLVSHTISHLESQTGVSKLKCLFLLEALYHNSPNLLAPILTPHSQVFQDVAESGESQSLRNKARDFLSLLGLSVPSPDPTLSQSDDLIETDTPSQSDDLIETVPDSLEAGGEEGSLFNGMLTSQESKLSASQPLISGLEDLTIPDNSTNLIGSDMIELGNTEKSFSFDPLLDTSHTSTTISTNQTISTSFLPSNNSLLASNNSLLSSNNSFIQSNNSFIQSNNSISIQISIPQPHSLIPINSRPAPQIDLKSEERKDSFGFISEHIRTLKDSKN